MNHPNAYYTLTPRPYTLKLYPRPYTLKLRSLDEEDLLLAPPSPIFAFNI